MIQTKELSMYYGKFCALNDLTVTIPEGCVYGLVGSNGAGKSTLLRILTGIYRPTSGEAIIDGENIFDNPNVKQKTVFIPDELYFMPQSSMNDMAKIWRSMYSTFDYSKFYRIASSFDLDVNANINTFSKGMKRQAALALAISAQPKYLFLDETFDGLDPIKRNAVRTLIYDDIMERGATAILSSHSLRELEDTCDQLSLLHHGGLVFESDIQNLKTSLFKVQVGFTEPFNKSKFSDLDMLSYKQIGSVATIIVRGDREEVRSKITSFSPVPVILDILPLNLEEVFIYELDALGYSDSLNEYSVELMKGGN